MIAVIIVNYGSPELTIRFVLEECVKIREEHVVIVVDNASTEDTFERLSRELPSAVILTCRENQGFARANNQGAAYALSHFHPTHILFSNNDIYFKDHQVADVLKLQMSVHPDVGIMGPQVLGLDGRRHGPHPPQTFAQRHLLPTWGKLFFKREKLLRITSRFFAEEALEGPCGWVSGSCFMVDARGFELAGGFDPHTFLYGEEQILSARFANAGYSTWYYPSVTVLHVHGATTQSLFDKQRIRKMTFRNECYYYRKYAGTPLWQILLGRFTLWLNIVRGR